MIGPTVDIAPVFGLITGLDLNAAMPWLTPSAKINCSRSSTFVRPLATQSNEQFTVCKGCDLDNHDCHEGV